MTSPFDWRAEPSKISGQIIKEARRRQGKSGWKDANGKLYGLSHKADERLRTSTPKKDDPS